MHVVEVGRIQRLRRQRHVGSIDFIVTVFVLKRLARADMLCKKRAFAVEMVKIYLRQCSSAGTLHEGSESGNLGRESSFAGTHKIRCMDVKMFAVQLWEVDIEDHLENTTHHYFLEFSIGQFKPR